MMMDVAQLDKDTADSIDTWVSHSLLKLLHLCYGLLMLIVDIYIYIYRHQLEGEDNNCVRLAGRVLYKVISVN